MKVRFSFESNMGSLGELHYDWQCPFLPRVGERLVIDNFWKDGVFFPSNERDRQCSTEKLEGHITPSIGEIQGISWAKHEDYFALIHVFVD